MDDEASYWMSDYASGPPDTESESESLVYQTVLTEKEALLEEKRALEAKIRALPPTAAERQAAQEREAEERRSDAWCNIIATVIFGWIAINVAIGLVVLVGAAIHSTATGCSMTAMHLFESKPAGAGSCITTPFTVGFVFLIVGLSPLATVAVM